MYWFIIFAMRTLFNSFCFAVDCVEHALIVGVSPFSNSLPLALTFLDSFLLVFVRALKMSYASKFLMEAFDVKKSHICDGKKMQTNVEGQNDSRFKQQNV